jgi:hypothetical protein
MKNLLFYRILTYILLATSGFLTFIVIGSLLAALANPMMLLPVFLLACAIIYSYCSFRFLSRGIDAHMYCRTSLRDLIRVNAIGAMVLGVMMAFNGIALKMNPALLDQALEQAMEMQHTQMEGMEEMMQATTRFVVNFILIYGIALVIHIPLTYRLLRQHADAFDTPPLDH